MSGATTLGVRVFIGTTAPADSILDFEGDTYTEVGGVVDVGDYGDEAAEVTSDRLSEGRTLKFKGIRNAGTLTLQVDDLPGDAGQDALIIAEGTNFDYNFRVEFDNAGPTDTQGGVDYFRAKVMSKGRNIGAANNMLRRTFNLGINSEIFEVAPA